MDTKREYEFAYLGETDTQVVPANVPFAKSLCGTQPTEQPMDSELLMRRQRLAAWVTHPQNHAFARATVNRVWAIMFGKPLVEPIDSIPLEGPHPAAMELLCDDFVNHGYDLRHLIRVIAATRVYRIDSRAPHEVTLEHEASWAAFPITRLRPEQVAGAIVQSASLATIDSQSHILQRMARAGQLGDFLKRFGDLGEDEFADFGSATIPQRLMMLNGDLVHERTKEDIVANAATRIAQQALNNTSALESAYLVVLTRRPLPAELDHFLKRLDDPEIDRAEQFEDMFWALLNSSEFCWNH